MAEFGTRKPPAPGDLSSGGDAKSIGDVSKEQNEPAFAVRSTELEDQVKKIFEN